MDTIKVKLQTMPLPKQGEPPMYKGTWDCFQKIVQKEGFIGLYKGMTAPLASVAPIFAMSFFGFGLGKEILRHNDKKRQLTKPELFAAGAFSGVFTVSVMAPGERIKCLLQTQQSTSTNKPKYNGTVDCAKQLYKKGGVRSIYKGSLITMIRDFPASGMYFMTYEWIKEDMMSKNASHDLKMVITIFAGGCAGVANWLTAMPADVLKTRLQTAPEGAYPNGIRDVYRDLMAKEGPTALYKGVIPVVLRAFPANAACFLGFELAVIFLTWAFPRL